MLSACGDSNQSNVKDYSQRMANVLEMDLPYLADSPLVFPSLSQSKFDLRQGELSIREFMSMRQCKLHTVIAHKNSQIGKVAPASQVLFSDLRVLLYGPECVDQLMGDDQVLLANKLDDYLNLKKQMIEQSAWHAILGSPENAKFWSSGKVVENYPHELLVEPSQSIQILLLLIENIKNNRYFLSSEQENQIEQSLQTLSHADGGLLLQHLSEINSELLLVNQLIERAIDKPLCFNSQPNQKATYLKNVVLKFFIGQVQHDLVDLLKRYQQLIPSYLELEKPLSNVTPVVYQQWQNERNQLFEQAHDSAKHHVQKLLLIFSQCGMQFN